MRVRRWSQWTGKSEAGIEWSHIWISCSTIERVRGTTTTGRSLRDEIVSHSVLQPIQFALKRKIKQTSIVGRHKAKAWQIVSAIYNA